MTYVRRVAVIVAAAVAVLMIQAVPALAQTAPGYEAWAGCPDDDPLVFICLRSDTESGHIQIGDSDVPITETITLSGGIRPSDAKLVSNSEGGLIAEPMNVPGGLSGLTGLSEFLINLLTLGAHKVYAQPVLVDTPTVGPLGATLNVSLPIKVKLINPFLTSTCAIGSESDPVVLNVTTGTTDPPPPNEPISGQLNPFSPISGLPSASRATDIVLVDNAFAAPEASGCTLFGFGLLNPLVNFRVGLPSPAGTNTAVQSDTTVSLAVRSVVYP